MKSISTSLIIIITSLAFLGSVHSAGLNIIPNSSLEIHSSANSGEPDSWFPDFYGTMTPTFTYPSPGNTGQGVGITVKNYVSGDAKWFFVAQPVTPNHTYIFSDFYKSTVPTSVLIQLTLKTGKFKYVNIGNATASANWKKFTTSFFIPVNAIKATIFHRLTSNGSLSVDDFSLVDTDASEPISNFSVSCAAKPSTAQVNTSVLWTATTDAGIDASYVWSGDDGVAGTSATSTVVYTRAGTKNAAVQVTARGVTKSGECMATITDIPSITPTPPFLHTHLPIISQNLIQNASFEEGINSEPSSWFVDGWGDNSPIFTYPVIGHTSARAVKVAMSSYADGDAKWFFPPVPATANTDYIYSDYYLSTTKTVVIVQFILSDGARRYIILDVLPAKSEWTKMEQTFNTPPGTVKVSVFHVVQGIGSLSVDDVSLHVLASGKFSQGMISLSFDDDDLSFFTDAAPLMDALGYRASQNVPTDFIGQAQKMTSTQLKTINNAGYEIDSHSITHPFLTNLSVEEAANEIDVSRTQLLSMGLSPITTFVYPFGDYNDDIEALVQAKGYTAARGTIPGFNTKNTDIYALHTQNVEQDTTFDEVKQWIDQAMANHTWLILGFHEIGDGGGTYDYTASSFQVILSYLKNSNANVVTTNTALKEMR